jgi:hypothetical protein
MSNFCPEWIFGVCSAKVAHDFLNTNNSVNMLSKKFSSELSARYNEVKFEEISDVAEKVLQFLSEINAGEDAINFLNDYIYYRSNFNINGSQRKIKSMFSSAFDAEKEKDYNSQKNIKIFKATIYSLRNGLSDKAPPGWVITDTEDIEWLGELFEQEVNISDL